MRAELEQVALIEKYLLQQMTADEATAFESKMQADSNLESEVDAQQKVMSAIKRVGLKATAVSAYGAWKFRKWLTRGTVAVMIIGGGYAAYYFATQDDEEPCVPCESEMYQGHGEDAPARPDNCCEDFESDAHGEHGSHEEHGHNFGFEIVFDTCAPYLADVEEYPAEEGADNVIDNEGNVVNNSNDNISSNDPQIEREGRLDTIVYTDEYGVDMEVIEANYPTYNTNTFSPRDDFLDSLQWKDDIRNGNVTEEPAFPGGQEALQDYLSRNMYYPYNAVREGLQGTVYVSFEISKDGSVKNARVVKGVHRILDKEAKRVVGEMPDWIPGKVNGKAADLKYTIPVNFILTGGDSEEVIEEASFKSVIHHEGYVQLKPKGWRSKRAFKKSQKANDEIIVSDE